MLTFLLVVALAYAWYRTYQIREAWAKPWCWVPHLIPAVMAWLIIRSVALSVAGN